MRLVEHRRHAQVPAVQRRRRGVSLGGDGHRGISSTTVVPEPCAEKTLAEPPASSMRPTMDSRYRACPQARPRARSPRRCP